VWGTDISTYVSYFSNQLSGRYQLKFQSCTHVSVRGENVFKWFWFDDTCLKQYVFWNVNEWMKERMFVWCFWKKNAKIRRQQLSWLGNVWVSVCFLLFWLLFYSILIKKISWVMYKMRSVYDWKNAFAKIAWEGRRLCGNMWSLFKRLKKYLDIWIFDCWNVLI